MSTEANVSSNCILSSSSRLFAHRTRSLSEGPIRRYNFTFDTGFLTDDTNFDISDSEFELESVGSSPERGFHSSGKPRTAYRRVRPGRLHRINLPDVGTAHFGINVPDEQLPRNEEMPDGNIVPELPRETRAVLNESGEPIKSSSSDEREAATVSVGFNHAHPSNRPRGVGASQSRFESETESRLSRFGSTSDGIAREYYEQYVPRCSRPVATDATEAATQRRASLSEAKQENTQDIQTIKNGEGGCSRPSAIPIYITINIDYDPALLDVRGYDVTATPRITSAGHERGEEQQLEEEQGGDKQSNCRMH
ncbi:hypothetical protein F4776DRAFT_659829 [Hypoxylon sp. NC0597]|nr:hypothetical protein F4776DRAFT_659829 [Hypoxylon sp. NC0597]